jgi:hypothetical protein
MSGASESGDDLVVGYRNESDDSTSLIAFSSDDMDYGSDYVLEVSTSADDPPPGPVDAIHATGRTLGSIGSGIISTGHNGVVGYVDAMARDLTLEGSVGAGLLGVGGAAAPGVFGRGHNGIVGYEQSVVPDPAFDNMQKAGVLGRGDSGVKGIGVNGPGVHGTGAPQNPGVLAETTTDPKILGPGIEGGPGMTATGETGVFAFGNLGAGLVATSQQDRGARLNSKDLAQLNLQPIHIKHPASLRGALAGDLVATTWRSSDAGDAIEIASLWFCTIGDSKGGPPTNWVKLA